MHTAACYGRSKISIFSTDLTWMKVFWRNGTKTVKKMEQRINTNRSKLVIQQETPKTVKKILSGLEILGGINFCR